MADQPVNKRRRLIGYLLYVTVTGAAILAIELLGSRVMAPYYGTTIIIWTALIAITLAALAIGYIVGGLIIDRFPKPQPIHLSVIAAGICVILLQACRQQVLTGTQSMGMHMGAAVSATVLFLPPLLLLGMVSPMVIRLNIGSVKRAGRIAGAFYAVSTLGSVIGAVLTGFVLVEYVSTSRLLLGIAAFLIALGGGGLLLNGKRAVAGSAAGIWILATLATGTPRVDAKIVKHHARSAYGNHQVLDIQQMRYLSTDGLMHTIVRTNDGENIAPYVNCMELLPCLRPDAKTSLQIGLGGGLVPTIFSKHYDITSDIVEIDEAIVPIAKTYFGFESTGDVYIEDGRTHFTRSDRKYDFIVLDVFNTDRQPWHLFTREYFDVTRQHLNEGGIFAINVFGFDRSQDSKSWHSVVHTVQAVYPEVDAYIASFSPKAAKRSKVNIVIFASESALGEPQLELARPQVRKRLDMYISQQIDLSDLQPAGILLTDNFNPLDRMTAPIFLAIRRDIQKSFGEYLVID